MEAEQSDLGYNTEELRAMVQKAIEGSLISTSEALSKVCSEESDLRGEELRHLKNHLFSTYRQAVEALRDRKMQKVGSSFGSTSIDSSLLPANLESLSLDLADPSLTVKIKPYFPLQKQLVKYANDFSADFIDKTNILPLNSKAWRKIIRMNTLEKHDRTYQATRDLMEDHGLDVSLFPKSMYGFVNHGGHRE